MTDLRVSFACNDQAGRFLGTFEAVEIAESFADGGDLLARLIGPQTRLAFDDHGTMHVRSFFVVSAPYPCSRFRWHEGNISWCACDVPLESARPLLEALLALGFEVEEYAEESVIADIVSDVTAGGASG